MQSMTPG